MFYTQSYNPLPSAVLSTLVAALPVFVLFYLLVVRRATPPAAAAAGAGAAILVAVALYRMPAPMAGLAFCTGALFGIFPICWTIVNAMVLYNITVETGKFEGIKRSVAGLSADHRLQAVLIAFAFGAFLEGAAGGGTPVAICGAMLAGLGFDPFRAAGICLIANTSPVAYGGFGTPILTLQSVTGLDGQKLSAMAGNQLPLLSCIVPLWLVCTLCGWRRTVEVLPAVAVAGISFAGCQFVLAHSAAYPVTDLAGGLISLAVTAAFLRVWRPRRIWRMDLARPTDAGHADSLVAVGARSAHGADAVSEAAAGMPDCVDGLEEIAGDGRLDGLTARRRIGIGEALSAWSPFLILCVLMVLIGYNKTRIDAWAPGPIRTSYDIHVPGLDQRVARVPPVVEQRTLESAVVKLNWLTMPGTPVFLSCLIVGAMLRLDRQAIRRVVRRTARQMAIPVPTIVFMLGLGTVTRLGGLDATLGMAFKNTGVVYPFFAAILGWIGVFLTGTDAASSALFGSLQKITSMQLGLSPILICVANSSGGVMGKMIDAQSICVATAATERVGTEADVFKLVVWHSAALACLVGLLVLLQAYVFPFSAMVVR